MTEGARFWVVVGADPYVLDAVLGVPCAGLPSALRWGRSARALSCPLCALVKPEHVLVRLAVHRVRP